MHKKNKTSKDYSYLRNCDRLTRKLYKNSWTCICTNIHIIILTPVWPPFVILEWIYYIFLRVFSFNLTLAWVCLCAIYNLISVNIYILMLVWWLLDVLWLLTRTQILAMPSCNHLTFTFVGWFVYLDSSFSCIYPLRRSDYIYWVKEIKFHFIVTNAWVNHTTSPIYILSHSSTWKTCTRIQTHWCWFSLLCSTS